MPQINWKPDFSFGNALTMISMFVAAIIGWNTLASETKANSLNIEKLDARLTAQEERFNKTMDAITQDKLRQTEVLVEVQTNLRFLRQAIEQIQTNQTKDQN